MGDDYDDDEEEEPSKGTSIADESEWEDDMDDDEEEEDYVGESDSEESGLDKIKITQKHKLSTKRTQNANKKTYKNYYKKSGG